MTLLEKRSLTGINREEIESEKPCIFQQIQGTSKDEYIIECKIMLNAIDKICKIEKCPIYQTWMLLKTQNESLEML